MNHPLTPEEIHDDNYHQVANDLFLRQCRLLSAYTSRIASTGYWSDDDTDYLRTALQVTEHLMDFAYDGAIEDFKYFLFTPRRLAWEDKPKGMESLHELDSGGDGLCLELQQYLVKFYEEEDNA